MASTSNALLVGGSKGMALETAKLLANRGIDLILVARSKQDLSEARDAIIAASDISVETISTDLYDRSAVSALIERIAADKRHIEYLVNAAGYFKPFIDTTLGNGTRRSQYPGECGLSGCGVNYDLQGIHQ